MTHAAAASSGVSEDEVGSEEVEEFVHEHPRLVRFARIGWVSKGVVYALVGVLALTVAFRDGSASGGDEASQTGAITRIAQASYGTTVLLVIAAGLVLYALWRIVTIVLPAENDAHTWVTRLGYAVSAIVYLLLAWTAFSYISRGEQPASGENSEEAKVDGFTRELMSHTGGQWLVGLIGAVIVGIGVYFFIRGTRRPFDDQLDGRGVGPLEHHHLVVLGRVGWIGRATMMALIGFFLVRAAWQADADEAGGLDGAVQRASSTPFGMVVVFVVGVGLIVYGIYCIVSAPRRRLAPADS